MINAVASTSGTAAELTYPAIVLENYLSQLASGQGDAPPLAALWAISRFLRDAIDPARTRIDPVASAVSYELADNAFRSAGQRANAPAASPESVDSSLRQFLDLLTGVENDPQLLPTSSSQVIPDLISFLRSLRLRGQGESYNRLASCV